MGENRGMEKNAVWFQSALAFLKKEFHRPEVYTEIIRPILWALMPYGIGFLVLNFLTTLLAVGMILYVRSFYVAL
jgi:hypothetical protein